MVRKVNILIILLLAVTGYANGATYYISNSGLDSNPGTSVASPWRTCGHATANMTGGDTLLFMGGIYSEHNTASLSEGSATLHISGNDFGNDLSGTPGHPTVFKPAPGYDRPIFIGNGANGYNPSCSTYAVEFGYPVDYVILDSLIVKWAKRGILYRTGTNVTIRNCVVCSTGVDLLGVNNNGGVIVLNVNNFADSLTVDACSLFYNREDINTSTGNCGGIECYGTRYSKFTNNVIFNEQNADGGIFVKGGRNHKIEMGYNVIYGGMPYGAGIFCWEADSCSIHHNIIYDCSKGINIPGDSRYGYRNKGDDIYNNTIWGGNYGIAITVGAPVEEWEGIEIWNNICVQSTYGLNKGTNATIVNDDKYIDYNCYWRSGSNIVSQWNGNNYNLAELRSIVHADTHSVNINPVFADPTNHDFHLTDSSPQILKTGGRGGAYASYIGALDPNLETFTVSGTVALSGGGGVSGVALAGLPGNPHTDNSGNYSATVTSGWSGTVTPNLTGYTFSPTSRTYSGINSDISGQDYTAIPDTDPPDLNGVGAVEITDRSARITWTTNEPATSQVVYGFSIPYSDTSELDQTLTLTHSVDLDNLDANTDYYFRALSVDAMGNAGASSDLSFHTLEPDLTPPVISNVATSNVTSHSAIITWTTDEPATSQVDYGLSAPYEGTVYSSTLVTNHTIGLVNLTPDTLYYFSVLSADASGNEADSGDFEFHTDTLSLGDWHIISIGAWDSVSGTYQGYSTDAINDSVINPQGGANTTWASNESNSSPHWVKFGFDSPVLAAGMVVYWAWNNSNPSWMCSQQYRIQYWDGSTFVDIDSVYNSGADSVTATWFNPVETDSIRYFQPVNMGPPNYPSVVWLTELELYGSLGIPAPEPVGTVILDDSSAMAVALPVDAQLPVFYEFALDIDSTYPSPQVEPALVVDTVISTTYGGLSPEYTYYWKCRAIATDLSDTSAWSYSESFYLNVSNTAQASEVMPENYSVVRSSYQTFQIKFYPPSANIYFEVDAAPDFSSPLASGPVVANSEGFASWQPDSSDISGEIYGNGIYYWRASADNASWSEFSFTVELDIHAYPVPFRVSDGNSQITFTNLPEKAKITVATVSGSVVFTQTDVGPGEWAWNVRNNKGRDLTSGVYLFAVDSAAGSAKGKIVVIR